ncbi:HD domain-containing phosphohydrolase [Bradyrhizobium sp. SYSU BS000235]|uniref:HD domain-containing phosphohydrolase n=1 Tax=Bradyrhizobium sp. SYSU BS000235 TaxID=3411332 RepID=UPI003C74B52F
MRVFDAVKALAFIGDLSMGQPTDHSLRTAWLASRLAAAADFSPPVTASAREIALVRWSGCTANAPGFADLLGDDVGGRHAMLTMQPRWKQAVDAGGGTERAVSPLARIHCEVSSEVGRILGLGVETECGLRHIFEAHDGSGMPDRLAGNEIPQTVFVVGLAGDLEILSRNYGLERALALIRSKEGAQYPLDLVELLLEGSADWLRDLSDENETGIETALLTLGMEQPAAPEIIADVADLKMPWMAGFSRRVARSAARCCMQLGMDKASQEIVYRAGLIHGIGRAAVPNTIWAATTPLPASAWEKLRLVPYWTSRAGSQIAALAKEAEIASYAYERLDGSGYFRSAAGAATPREGQVLATAIVWEALRSRRPWREALTVAEAVALLRQEADRARLDREIVEQMIAPASNSEMPQRKAVEALLSPRETDVLRHISLGASNKEAARALGLSPSTVATHIESVFRKLGCSTRAAATLKASTLGLL